MSYTVEFDDERVWSGANWVYRELIRRLMPELRAQNTPTLGVLLDSPRLEAERVLSLRTVPRAELAELLDAARKALTNSESEGSSAFGTPEYFPAFMERFREFVQLLAGHLHPPKFSP